MKGITPLIIVVALLALVALFALRPGSIVDDCSKLSQVNSYVPYSKEVTKGFTITAGSGAGSYNRVVAIEGVPSYATVENSVAFITFGGNAFGRPTQRTAGLPYGKCGNTVLVAYDGDPAIGWVASDGGTMDYTNLGGTYTITYVVKFREAIPSVTPNISPPVYSVQPVVTPLVQPVVTPLVQPVVTPSGGSSTSQSSGRIPIISDVIDGIGVIIGGIIAFIAIPFIPPAP